MDFFRAVFGKFRETFDHETASYLVERRYQHVMSDSGIIDNTALHRFELHEQGGVAFLLYERSPRAVRLIHTEVPRALRGKGIGSRLVAGVLDLAEQRRFKVIPLCPFVTEYLRSHPEHFGIIDEEYRSILHTDRK